MLIDKLFNEKKRQEKNLLKYTTKAIKYAKKVQYVFGFFYYKEWLCTLNSNGTIEAPLLKDSTDIATLYELNIDSKEKLEEFRKELDKTVTVNVNLSLTEYFELFASYGESELLKDRDAIRYTIREDKYNALHAFRESDGKKWFGKDSGWSGCNSSFPYDYEEGKMKDHVIKFRNLIHVIELRNLKKVLER